MASRSSCADRPPSGRKGGLDQLISPQTHASRYDVPPNDGRWHRRCSEAPQCIHISMDEPSLFKERQNHETHQSPRRRAGGSIRGEHRGRANQQPGAGQLSGHASAGTTQSAQPGTPGARPVPSTSQPSCTPGIGNQPCLPSPTGSSASGGSMTTGPSGLPQVPPPTAPGSGASSQPPLQPCPPGTVSQSAAPCLPGGGTPLPPGASPPSPTATMPK